MNQETIFQTPCFIYDESVLINTIVDIKARIPSDVSLCFALKANALIVPLLKDRVDKFELCSEGEFVIAHRQGVQASQCVISGVNKNAEFIRGLIDSENASDFTFTIESPLQWNVFRAAAKQGKSLRILIRYSSGNQFGVDHDTLVRIVSEMALYPSLCFAGIEFYSGTQKLKVEQIQREIAELNNLAAEIKKLTSYSDFVLEYGPGLPVVYFQQHRAYEPDKYFNGLSQALQAADQFQGIVLEVGRAIAAACGTYVTSVVDVKHTNGVNIAIVDGGINQLVYAGQIMGTRIPYLKLIRGGAEFPVSGDAADTWDVYGSLCTTHDVLVKGLPVHELHLEDQIVFLNTGAYSVTEGISLFLSRELPSVYIRYADGRTAEARPPIPTWKINCGMLGDE